MLPVDFEVVSIGTFSGGSWGGQGQPGNTYEFFRVICPRLRREQRDGMGIGVLTPFTFLCRADAVRFAAEEAAREQAYGVKRAATEQQAAERRIDGLRIADLLQRFGVQVDRLLYSDRLAALEQMTAESAEAVRDLGQRYGCRDYDARVSGRLYRVRVGLLVSDSAVVPFEVAR